MSATGNSIYKRITYFAEKGYQRNAFTQSYRLLGADVLSHLPCRHSAATTMYFRRVFKKVKMSISTAKF